jgi:hypothetical protein
MILRLDMCEGPESQFRYAIVTLTPEDAARMLRRVELISNLVQNDPDLDYMIYAPESAHAGLLEDVPQDFFEQLPRIDNNNAHPVRQRGDLSVRNAVKPMSVLYCVCEFGVSWRLGTPHSNFETCYLPTSVLERVTQLSGS